MSFQGFNRALAAFKLADSTPGWHLVLDQQNRLTASCKEGEASVDEVIQWLIKELALFAGTEQFDSTVPKTCLYDLRDKALAVLKAKGAKQHPEYLLLKKVYFPLAQGRWDLVRAFSKQIKPDGDDLVGQKLLTGSQKNLAKADFKLLGCPRDMLLVEKLVLYHLKKLAKVQLAVAERVNHLFGLGCKVYYIGGSEYSKAIFYDIPTTQVETVHSAQRACATLVRAGADGISSTYLRQMNAHDDSMLKERVRDLLEINELIFKEKELLAGWRQLEFIGEGLYDIKTHKKLFETKSYLPRRRLATLVHAGSWYIDCGRTLVERPIAERFSTQQKIGECVVRFLASIEKTIPADDVAVYSQLTERIAKGIADSKCKIQNQGMYEIICFYSSKLSPDDEDFERYEVKVINRAQYGTLVEAIKALDQGIYLTIPGRLNEVVPEDRGYTLPEPLVQPRKVTPVKKRKPSASPPVSSSSSRSSSPESCDELVQPLAQLTIEPPKPQKSVRKVQVREPEIPEVSAMLKYDPRVLRWFRDEDVLAIDDEYKGKKFTEERKKWIWAEHSFGRFVDFYLTFGAHQKNKYQLLGDITIGNKTKFGSFTFTKDTDGLFFHRFFSKKPKELIVDTAYLEKAKTLLEKPALYPEKPQKPDVQARDKSYLLSETSDLVQVLDPKNSALIRIIKR